MGVKDLFSGPDWIKIAFRIWDSRPILKLRIRIWKWCLANSMRRKRWAVRFARNKVKLLARVREIIEYLLQ